MLTRTLHAMLAVRPDLPADVRFVVGELCRTGGALPSSGQVAAILGLSSRFALGRIMKRHHLPSIARLRRWFTVLAWVGIAQRDHVALCTIAFRIGRYPAACYRTARSVTGSRWSEVLARGAGWVERRILELFLSRYAHHVSRRRLRGDAARMVQNPKRRRYRSRGTRSAASVSR